MSFETPLDLFQHLLNQDESNLLGNLEAFAIKGSQLYDEVVELINAHNENKKHTIFGAFIGSQINTLAEDCEIEMLEGEQLGVYSLVKKLGQGGMGVVYLGKRNDEQLEQQVAIKLLFPSVTLLFKQQALFKEAQHLANLSHPNIAKVFTVDVSENGIPYMVMEYIEGEPLDKYCDKHKLSLNERLTIFIQVCNAVNEAHNNLIVHADLKPSNILIDKLGAPKVLDFGIAQPINLMASEHAASRAGSLAFASPEQLAGKPLSISSDIYSLGKILECIIKNVPIRSRFIERWLNDCIYNSTLKGKSERIQNVEKIIFGLNEVAQLRRPPWSKGNVTEGIATFILRNPWLVFSTVTFLLLVSFFTYSLSEKNKLLTEQNEAKKEVINLLSTLFNRTKDHESQFSVFDLVSEKQVSHSEIEQDIFKQEYSPFQPLVFTNHGASINEPIKIKVIEDVEKLQNHILKVVGGGLINNDGFYQHTFQKAGVYPIDINIKVKDQSHHLRLNFIISDKNSMPFIFSDVAETDRYYFAVRDLALSGVLIGRPGPSSNKRVFEPHQYVKRAEALKIIMLSAYLRNIVSLSPSQRIYPNLVLVNERGGVEDFSWAAVFLQRIEELQLLEKVDEMNPKSLITRAWLAELLVNLLQLIDPSKLNAAPINFKDKGNFLNKKQYEIAQIISFYQLLSPIDGAFLPENPMTRSEVAEVAAKILSLPKVESDISGQVAELSAENVRMIHKALLHNRNVL